MIRIDPQRGRRPGSHDGDGATRGGKRTRALALGGSVTAWLLALAFVTVGTVRALPRVTTAAARDVAPAAAARARAPADRDPDRVRAARGVVTPAGPAREGPTIAPARAARDPRTAR